LLLLFLISTEPCTATVDHLHLKFEGTGHTDKSMLYTFRMTGL
jgi:hypothetical protein